METTNQTVSKEKEVTTNSTYLKIGNTTVEVVAHFSSERTYEDVIKAALRREFKG